MVKPMKKFCSFAMAVCVAAGAICVPVSAQTDAEAKEAINDKVDLLAEATYDEAVTFTDSVAFLENGNWSGSEWIDGEVVQSENVTEKTNIVVVDSEGNKKVIANDDGKGGRLFDAIFPMISSGSYQFDALKLIKGNQMAYLKADGSFIGGKKQYYNYAMPITEDILFVSDDKETYRVLNSKGEITVDNIKNVNHYYFDVAAAYGDLRYIFCSDNCYVLDNEGNLIKEVGESLDISYAGNGYSVVRKASGLSAYLIDRTGKVVKKFEGFVSSVSATYIEEGYIQYYLNGEGYIIENINTGKIVSKTQYSPTFDGNIIFSDNYLGEKRSLYSVDGTVYIEDMDKFICQLAAEEGYESVSSKTYFINNSFFISMYDELDTSKTITYVLTEQSGFVKDSNKKMEGLLQSTSVDKKYFMTANYEGYIRNMCTIDGTLIKNFKDNSKYAYAGSISKDYGGVSYDTVQFAFRVSDKESEYWGARAYILSNGEISQTYYSLYTVGNFIVGCNSDGIKSVINGENKVVYNGAGYIDGYYYRECFSVEDNDTVMLYDRDGNIILGADGKYAGICEGGYGSYTTNEYDDTNYYSYSNDMLPNGMCVVSIVKDGSYKYGVVKIADNIKISDAVVKLSSNKYTYDGKAKMPSIKSITVNGVNLVEGKDYTVSYKNNVRVGKATVVITGLGDYNGVCNVPFEIINGTGMFKAADGKWYYYKNGVIDKTYNGLAKNTYGWWYMNKGKLDTSYTGLVKYKSNWVYVVNGKLNSTYTGLVKYKSNWVYVNKGKLDASYTGLVKYKSNWVYVVNGKLNSTYTGLVKYKSNWVYVDNGKLNSTYTGLVKYKSNWVYVNKGKLAATYTGMAKNQYGWWYVSKGKLDLGYTGIAKNAYGTWYLQKGKLDLTFSGNVTVAGKTYTIKNGKVK